MSILTLAVSFLSLLLYWQVFQISSLLSFSLIFILLIFSFYNIRCVCGDVMAVFEIADIRLEVQTMRLSSHPNILVCHTSFVRDTDLWLVTQLMNKGSSLHCLQSARAKLLTEAAANANNDPNLIIPQTFTYTSDDSVLEGGLTAYSSLLPPENLVFEAHITYILYETLLGLKYIHDNGQIHRDIKAGNLLLDKNANVRIADFGVSSWLIDSGNRREHTTTFVGTPCWMAPEVMEQVDGYDYKADIWSLGITALELCKGYAPYAKYAPMKVLLLTIQEDPPSLETYNDGDDTIMVSYNDQDYYFIPLHGW